MTFDGVKYNDGSLVYAYDHHPFAPMTGLVFSKALQNAYFHARVQGRGVFQQSYGSNFKFPAAQFASDVAWSTFSSDYAAIGGGYRTIPPLATHLRAAVLFGCIPFADVSVYHRLGFIPPGGTIIDLVVGDAVITPVPAGGTQDALSAGAWMPEEIQNAGRTFWADCSVPLATLTLPARIEALAFAVAYGTVAAQYKAFFIACWWEIRD